MTPLALPAPVYRDNIYTMDALAFLRCLPDASVDAAITDPPYPGAVRSYGEWTEREWMQLMRPCVLEMRRVLKPTGSAVIIIQPNCKQVGSMRSWVWDFLSWASRKWNVVQDVYWWNFTPFPTVHAHRDNGLMRPSIKNCVWLGAPNCHRNQDSVLWGLSDSVRAIDLSDRALRRHPSGGTKRPARVAETALMRGGSTPINLLPIANTNSTTSGGAYGHGAATPRELVEWWMRYLTRPGDLVCDPFMGSGTTALVAQAMQRHYVGCERLSEYVAIANERLSQPRTEPLPLFVDAPAPVAAAVTQMEMSL